MRESKRFAYPVGKGELSPACSICPAKKVCLSPRSPGIGQVTDRSQKVQEIVQYYLMHGTRGQTR